TMGAAVDPMKVEDSLLKAGLGDLINQLPGGVKELLGKEYGGTDFSKGQWQKIAIAKAFYKDLLIYILYEPTSSLDPMSDHDIFNRFIAGVTDKMVLFVTHRLSLTAYADRIFLLDDGKLINQGSHEQMMSESDIYKNMFDVQAHHYITLAEIHS